MHIAPIRHLTYTMNGGAGAIAALLASSQKDLGFDAEIVVAAEESISSKPLSHPIVALAAVLDQYVLAKPSAELISIARAKLKPILQTLSAEGTVVNLHWTTGAISELAISEMLNSGLKVFWTLHDFRPLTGACHFPKGCEGFTTGCKKCPQLRAPFGGIARVDLSRANRKSNPILVAPSAGLAEAAKRSYLGMRSKVLAIPNPVRRASISTASVGKEQVGSCTNFLFIAANVDEPRKGLRNVLNWWDSHRPAGGRLTLAGKNSAKYSGIVPGVTGVGSLTGEGVDQLMSSHQVLLFASSEDNAPGVLAEALRNGLAIVCLDDNMKNWLQLDGVPVIDGSLAVDSDLLRYYLEATLPALRDSFLINRDPEHVARKYIDAYFS